MNDRFLVTARIGIFDGFAYPYGFGVKEEMGGAGHGEPIRLVHSLYENYGLLDQSDHGNLCRVSTHVTVPMTSENMCRMNILFWNSPAYQRYRGGEKAVFPNMVISASGPSYLRQYSDLCLPQVP